MTDISVWLRDALPRTPGASRAVVKREFRLTLREFFAQSYTWREIVYAMPLVAGQTDYLPVPADPVNSEVVAVLGVARNGTALYPLPWAPADYTQTGTPAYWHSPATIRPAVRVHPIPTVDTVAAGVTIDFEIVVMPSLVADTVPDWVYTQYYDGLFDGVLGRLYAHPAKAYSNTTAAAYHLNRFRTAIQQASGAAKQGHVVGQNWRFPRFGK